MPDGSNYGFLAPLFQAIAPYYDEARGQLSVLAEPALRSSLVAEDALLKPHWSAGLIRSTLTRGVGHVLTVQHLIAGGVLDPAAVLTLLRASLENFSTATWLISAPRRAERLERCLRLWAADYDNRSDWEKDTGWSAPAEGMSGAARLESVYATAEALGIPRASVARRPSATSIITEASQHAHLDAGAVRAAWRVASGFAHGRFWPSIFAGQPLGATRVRDGAEVLLVIENRHIAALSEPCLALLEHTVRLYMARSGRP